MKNINAVNLKELIAWAATPLHLLVCICYSLWCLTINLTDFKSHKHSISYFLYVKMDGFKGWDLNISNSSQTNEFHIKLDFGIFVF